MATCNHPSDLVHCIAYPVLLNPRPRIASRLPELPEEQLPAPSNQQEIEGSLFLQIESGATLRRNPWVGVAAVSLQMLLLLALVLIPLFHTDPLPKRETLTMLYLQPPSAGGGNVAKMQAPKLASAYTPTSTTIAQPIHKTQEVPPTPAGAEAGVVGGVPAIGGSPTGVLAEAIGSARSVPVPIKTPDPPPVKRIRVASRVVEANLIHDVAPQYPPEAGRARVEGTVVLMAVIGTDGSVKDVRVESGLPMLAQAAIDAVRQWRYKPYMIDGEPVEVDSRITINFTLRAS
jgi:periplasmic protein TonB